MSWDLRILCMLAGALVFSVVVRLLIKRKMDEANSFLWLPLGFIALVAGFFPDLFGWTATRLGVQNADTLVLITALILLIFVVFKNSADLSNYKSQNHELSMQVSMLNSEVRQLIEITGRLETPEGPRRSSKRTAASVEEKID